MTGAPPSAGTAPGRAEAELTLRVLSALLREDVVGLRTRSELVRHPDGPWLRLPVPDTGAAPDTETGNETGNGTGSPSWPGAGGAAARPPDRAGGAWLLPVREDGFQAVYAARLPLLRSERQGSEITGLDGIVRTLRGLAEPVDRGGFDTFAEECRQTLATMRLHTAVRDEVGARLTTGYGPDPARWTGLGGSLAYDTLAAHLDHPVYPTARGRSGLTEAGLRPYAPEFHPRFALRWLALPTGAVTAGTLGAAGHGTLPGWWPTPAEAGLPTLDGSHVMFPAHPLTAAAPGLAAAGAVPAPRPGPEVIPTLSMRTVALAAHPAVHLKLPLATATLGLRNRRTIKPGTLEDGAAAQRLLTAVIGREPHFRASVLLADESRYAQAAAHELLAVLVRRYPDGLDDAVVLPMAALLAPAPDDRLVIDHLAGRFYAGDPAALLDACLTLLFDWQTTLFSYGIALESHQQNVSLVLDRRPDGRTRLRLLLKDNDGLRINAARLGQRGLAAGEFDDARIFVSGDGPLVDVFTTITVHLCAGAYAFGLARQPGRVPLHRLQPLLRLVRDRLAEAVERAGPGAHALRAGVLEAAELPVKAMVTAGTLLSKERSGAADVNKHYTTGPNYLRNLPEADR